MDKTMLITCKKCRQTKKEGAFYKKSTNKNGRDSICKECRRYEMREYRAANKEKIKQYNRKYKEANRERIKQVNRKYKEANRAKSHEIYLEYREANREKIKQNNRKYVEANKEKIKQYNRKYEEANREKIKEQKYKYREANREKIINSDGNMRRLIIQRTNLKAADIPPGLIDLKRNHLRLHRAIQEKKS